MTYQIKNLITNLFFKKYGGADLSRHRLYTSRYEDMCM
jgi:hypothetical protein